MMLDAAQHDVQEGINCVWKEAVAQNFVVNKQRIGLISEQITQFAVSCAHDIKLAR